MITLYLLMKQFFYSSKEHLLYTLFIESGYVRTNLTFIHLKMDSQ